MSTLVFTYSSPVSGGVGQRGHAEDLVAALREALAELVALGRDSGSLSAAHYDPGQERPFRYGGTGLGEALLFRTGDRAVHVVGDSQVAAEARRALAAGDVRGWSLHPVRGSRTPLQVLRAAVPTRTYRVLSRYGYSTVEEVEATPDAGLRRLHGAGAAFIAGVRTAIADLELEDPEPEHPEPGERQPAEAPIAWEAAASVHQLTPAAANPVVILYRTPLGSWEGLPDEAPDVTSALRGLAGLMGARNRDSAKMWAARRADDEFGFPYRLEEALGGANLFLIGRRAAHVVGDSQVAAEARQALTAGDVQGWTLQPTRPSSTPLHVLRPLLTTRFYGILTRHRYSTVEEVEATPEAGLFALGGAGVKFIDAVHTAIADLGLGEIADLPITTPSTADQAAHRRQLLTRLLDPGPALRNRDLVELLARSSVPPTALRLIADALNSEPAPPADPAVVALLDTAGEQAILGHYTRTRTAGDQVATEGPGTAAGSTGLAARLPAASSAKPAAG